jgi:hypothetical protein
MQKTRCFDGRSEHHNYFSYIPLTVRIKMQNQDNRMDPRPSPLDGIIERLKGQSRLSPADKKVFAVNLGLLSARLDEAKPLNGAKQIVEHSNQEGILKKRKRFFRFPGEDTPDNAKEGEYGSNPATFISLAKAAGELLCKSTKPETIERERQAAIKALITGSTHMPTYVPSNSADISAKGLLDDYAQALSEAIESRTKITDLWKILETTDIGLDVVFSDEEGLEVEPSSYGNAAVFPPQLLAEQFEKHTISAQFNAGGPDAWDPFWWVYPRVNLGYITLTPKIDMFCIPEEQRALFNGDHKSIISALSSLGFDLIGDVDPPEYNLNERDPGAGWKQVTASIIVDVQIGLKRDETKGVKIVLYTRPTQSFYLVRPCKYVIDTGWGEKTLAEQEKQMIESDMKLSQVDRFTIPASSFVESPLEREGYHLGLVYSELFDPSEKDRSLPVAILPYDILGFDEFDNNVASSGWAENEFQAKMLLGTDDIRFYPSNPEVEPIAGILRSGSVGASLLHNLNAEGEANSITTQLIEKAALTAEAGLKFYEAMLEEHRSAIRKI